MKLEIKYCKNLIIILFLFFIALSCKNSNEPDSYKPQQIKKEEIVENIRDYLGYPPKMDTFIEYVKESEIPNWDYEVFIYEAAEEYLGTEQFYSLESRFASIPGVEEVKHDDRELFLVRSKNLSAEDIRNGFWKQILEAARVSFDVENSK